MFIYVEVRRPSAVWCFDLQREEKVPARLLPKFCTLCTKVRQLLHFDRDDITTFDRPVDPISVGSLRNHRQRSAVNHPSSSVLSA